jgi:hypothetical protein
VLTGITWRCYLSLSCEALPTLLLLRLDNLFGYTGFVLFCFVLF